MDKIIDEVYNSAKKVLRGNYKEKGIYAGKNHFDDYWGRDGFFASLAALELKDYTIVKKNLLLFINYQREDGEIPLRIGNRVITPKFFGIKVRRENLPRYKDDKNVSYPLDQTLLFLIAASEYVKKTKDSEFAKKYYKNFRNALNFILTYTDGVLLNETPYSNWEDSLKLKGHVIYTSVCYYQALRSLSYLANVYSDKGWVKNYSSEAERVKEAINKEFWNGSYFSLMHYKGKRYDYFNTSGNLLSIYWDLATKEQAISIEKYLEKVGINKFVPSLTNHPKYPLHFIFLSSYIFRMNDYHNGQCWLWLGCLDALIKAKLGMKKEAKLLLDKIARIVSTYNGFYEVYNKRGTPVNRFFYKSEENFSWAAAFYILAYNSIY